MNISTINQSLPPGLVDNSSEFFTDKKECHELTSGHVISHDSFPTLFKNLLRRAIKSDPVASKALTAMGLTSDDDQIIQFYNCNYSAYDTNPDITAAGRLGEREYVQCGKRGTCAFEGKLCQLPYGLTKRQVEVLAEIGIGASDEELCENLFINIETLRTHKRVIFQKTGKSNKSELAVLANQLNLKINK